ncbi:dynein light chain Tctex-type 1 isoform X1 [Oryzias melastigma]|uniref:Dynein light chain Tctex-type 3 n=1 Tax=Oryzias melastigma TaxID=30732 RepID=A0A3B3CA65_ORYME|nr:dynein light chain Tctex-type 1 isoform X1 [Oryzias melastigma]
MEDFHNGNEGSFNSEETDGIVKECIENVVGGDDYSANLVNKWTAGIVERCLAQLVKQGKPYKYIVTCAVMQKTGAGLHTANSCYWDTAMDVFFRSGQIGGNRRLCLRQKSSSMRKLHREVGEPHHVLRGQRVCGGCCLEPTRSPFRHPPGGCRTRIRPAGGHQVPQFSSLQLKR